MLIHWLERKVLLSTIDVSSFKTSTFQLNVQRKSKRIDKLERHFTWGAFVDNEYTLFYRPQVLQVCYSSTMDYKVEFSSPNF